MINALKMLLLIAAVIFILYAIYAATKGFYSLFRAKACKKLTEQGKKYLWENNIISAVTTFLKAEKKWSINSHDGGRESLITDIDLYASICRGLFKALHIHTGSLYRDVFGILDEMKSVIKNRSNFAVDGRKMKPEALARWEGLLGRLNSLRKPIHDTCKPKMQMLRS